MPDNEKQAINNTLLGHPKGLFLVSGVELWERFSYYGMLGLLVLFLTADAATGGFNWSSATALKLMGIYTGFVFASPAVGGWVANRFWGERRCILYGGLLVVCGHLLLGGPVYFPILVDVISAQNTALTLKTTGLSYEVLFLSEKELAVALANNDIYLSDASWTLVAYHLKLWSFLLGLLFIIIGTGLIKPAVSSIINHFYQPGAKERQTGFAIFMASIYLGSFCANFIAGTLGEKVGWHLGFSVAAAGMLIGVIAYLLGQQTYLGELGRKPQNIRSNSEVARPSLTAEYKQRIALILLMGFFTVVYAVAFYQKGGLLNLYTKQNIDRSIFNFEVPATWFLSISTGTFILFAPFATHRFRQWFPSLDAMNKLAIGLLLIASGYLLLSVAEFNNTNASIKVSFIWMVLTYIFFGLGDIFVWPAQIAAAAALAPKHLTSFIVGAWYLTIGLGSWLTGYVGALSQSYSHFAVFTGLAIACFTAAGLLMLMHKWALQLAHGVRLS